MIVPYPLLWQTPILPALSVELATLLRGRNNMWHGSWHISGTFVAVNRAFFYSTAYLSRARPTVTPHVSTLAPISTALVALAMVSNDNDDIYKQLCRIIYCLGDKGTKTYSTMLKNIVRRSHHGCTRCKKRRQKCDELRPCCGRCIEAGSQCSYTKALKWLVAPRKVGRKKRELSTGERSCGGISQNEPIHKSSLTALL